MTKYIREMDDFSKHVVERESRAMGDFLLSLLEEGFITTTEYQLILSINQFCERCAVIYEIMLSKPEAEAMKIFKKFWKLNSSIHMEKYSILLNSMVEESQNSLVKKDPLSLNYDVMEHLFKFIPLNDLKNCCLVSKQWNSTLQPILRNRTTIHFESDSINLRPSVFLHCFEKSLDPPFTSFEISGELKAWNITELDNFFNKWGKKIRKLKFHGVRLEDLKKNVIFTTYNLSPWIEQAPNLTKLKIRCLHRCTIMEIELDKLNMKLKSISLEDCILNVPANITELCGIAPLKIELNDVDFKQGEKFLKIVDLNDYFDFGKAIKINLDDNGYSAPVLDMKRQVFNAQRLHLCTYINMHIENWKEAEGNIFFLFLRECSLLEKSRLEVKQLLFADSTIDLSVLPHTIEKLHFYQEVEFICTKPINLPKLNFLSLELLENNSSSLSHFTNCANLEEIKLSGSLKNRFWTLNVDLIPKSVKRIKIIHTDNVNIWGDVDCFQLNTLILEDHFINCPFTAATKIICRIKPKNLVLSILDSSKLDTTDILKFVLLNRQLQKVVVGCEKGLHPNVPFVTSILSHFVDKEANFYQFENGFGQSLTSGQFESWTKLQELEHQFYPHDLYFIVK